jgi:hypothetical protein
MSNTHDLRGLSMPHSDVKLPDGRSVRVGRGGAEYLGRMARERCVPRGEVTGWGYGGQRGRCGIGTQYEYLNRLVTAGLLRYRFELTPAERQRTSSQAMVEITPEGLYVAQQLGLTEGSQS